MKIKTMDAIKDAQSEMTRYKILGKLPKIRNKYVKAVLVTKDNYEELEKRNND